MKSEIKALIKAAKEMQEEGDYHNRDSVAYCDARVELGKAISKVEEEEMRSILKDCFNLDDFQSDSFQNTLKDIIKNWGPKE